MKRKPWLNSRSNNKITLRLEDFKTNRFNNYSNQNIEIPQNNLHEPKFQKKVILIEICCKNNNQNKDIKRNCLLSIKPLNSLKKCKHNKKNLIVNRLQYKLSKYTNNNNCRNKNLLKKKNLKQQICKEKICTTKVKSLAICLHLLHKIVEL